MLLYIPISSQYFPDKIGCMVRQHLKSTYASEKMEQIYFFLFFLSTTLNTGYYIYNKHKALKYAEEKSRMARDYKTQTTRCEFPGGLLCASKSPDLELEMWKLHRVQTEIAPRKAYSFSKETR